MTEPTKYESGRQETTEGDGGQFDDALDCPNDANAEQDRISGFYPHQQGRSLRSAQVGRTIRSKSLKIRICSSIQHPSGESLHNKGND